MFDLNFSRVDLKGAIQEIIDACQNGEKGMVVTPNINCLVKMNQDPEMKRLYQNSKFIYADGMPVVWFSKLFQNLQLPERVTGADLVPGICEAAAKTSLNIYFLGGNEGVAAGAAKKLREQYPGVRIVGTYCPPMGFEKDSEECQRIVDDINAKQADILFIGVGAPKQTKWADKHMKQLNVNMILCVGGAFDFVLGTVTRAPEWVQRVGGEWLWRLVHEPKRLWKRYLVDNAAFFPLAYKEYLKLKSMQ